MDTGIYFVDVTGHAKEPRDAVFFYDSAHSAYIAGRATRKRDAGWHAGPFASKPGIAMTYADASRSFGIGAATKPPGRKLLAAGTNRQVKDFSGTIDWNQTGTRGRDRIDARHPVFLLFPAETLALVGERRQALRSLQLAVEKRSFQTFR